MSIHGVNGLNGVSAANQVSSVKRNDVSENASKPVARDEMEISTQNRAEAAASVSFDSEGIRVDLVNRVRAEIAAGTYYSDEKFEKALDRLFAAKLGHSAGAEIARRRIAAAKRLLSTTTLSRTSSKRPVSRQAL